MPPAATGGREAARRGTAGTRRSLEDRSPARRSMPPASRGTRPIPRSSCRSGRCGGRLPAQPARWPIREPLPGGSSRWRCPASGTRSAIQPKPRRGGRPEATRRTPTPRRGCYRGSPEPCLRRAAQPRIPTGTTRCGRRSATSCPCVRARKRDPTRNGRSAPDRRADLHPAPERLDPVLYVLQPLPPWGGRRVEPPAVVLDFEPQRALLRPEPDGGRGRVRILRRVLEGLEDAEVRSGLGLGRVPAEAVGLHGDRERHLPGLGLEGRREPLVGQERRIDPAGQVPEVLEGLLALGFGLAGPRRRLGGGL